MHTAKVDEAIFNTEANIAAHLVLQTGTDRPSVPPVAEGEAVGPNSVMPRHIDVSASPSRLGVNKPLVNRKTQTTGHSGDRAGVGAVCPGRRLRATKVVAQCGTAQRCFGAEHQISELFIVADLAAANETTRIVVDALACQIDIGPVNSRPGTTELTTDIETGPAYEWHCCVRSWRSRIAVSHRRGRNEPRRDSDECDEAKLHAACPFYVRRSLA